MEEVQQQQQNAVDKSENDLECQVQKLERENKRMREEFDSQRAKMKELFLQKEDELARKNKENASLNEELHQLKAELGDVKSQLVVADLTLESNLEVEKRKAEEEIASLQQLVHETVEESSSSRSIYDIELKKLQSYIIQLKNEIKELKNEKQHSPHHTVQEQTSLAPSVMLSAVTKRLVKKLGADAFTSQDCMEDSMRKVDADHAQEDAEMLRSLVIPLEEEIKALKDKLRATDEQLQKCKQCGHLLEQEAQIARGLIEPSTIVNQAESKQLLSTTATNTSFDSHKYSEQHSPAQPCDMCSNYEAQLVKEQQTTAELRKQVVAAEKAAERHREDLLKEIGFRKDMEEKWNEKKEEHKQQVKVLTRQTECAEQDLKECRDTFNQICSEIRKKLETLTHDRENIQAELTKLQNENDNLVGKYSVHSQQLQSEMINLPDTVEELHELLLKYHEDLIVAKIGKETAEEEADRLKYNIKLLEDQMRIEQDEKKTIENNLVTEINELKKQQHSLEKDNKMFLLKQEKYENLEKINQEQIGDLKTQLHEIKLAKKQLDEQNEELRRRVTSLQQELDTSEAVQKDFVSLSQSLQVELEKIRASDSQVRWQHEEDIEECSSCKNIFSTKKNKQHCRHCGQIFCLTCLTHVVPSGPNMRPSKVCDVCHTLLVKSSAPYFSEAPPQT